MRFVTSLCVSFMLFFAVEMRRSANIQIPIELKKILSDAASLEEMRSSSIPGVAKRATAAVSKCEAPDDISVTIRRDNRVLIAPYPGPMCLPREQPVKLEVSSTALPMPSYVNLFRCSGYAFLKQKHCAVAEKEEILVKYLELSTFKYDTIKVYNHTKCAEVCIQKQSDCKKTIEIYQNCECICNDTVAPTLCNATLHTYNPHTCGCDCKPTERCPLYREKNPTTCMCECASCLRKMCEAKNLVIDEATCSCK